MSHIKIPYEDLKAVNTPYFSVLKKKADQIIEGGWYILGNSVEEFELKFSQLHSNLFCLGVASGLDALILGLASFNFPKGSKVLVPSNTYIASILAVLRADLIPILVEPDPLTYNITVDGLAEKYDSSCVAILPVHLYGRLCHMKEIVEFAKIYNLKVIEDCAQAHFAMADGKKSGEFGDIGAFSFYPTKIIGALGDAGAIICKDEEIYNRLKALRNYGSNQKYINKYVGWNSRLDELQAGFLLTKIDDWKNIIAHKRKLAYIYLENLKHIKNIQLPLYSNENHVWHIFNILVKNRTKVREKLLKVGIGTEVHYPIPPHKQVGYKDVLRGEYPISEKIHNETLSLPISSFHTESDIFTIISELIPIINRNK